MNWLDPLRAALDTASRPVTFFFRDDDAGWADDRLRRLLALFDRFGAPLDLAVIPCALGPGLARELRDRRPALGLHQHGFAHSNHEPNGRKCEFGPARAAEAQRADIERGRTLLEELLEAPLDPIFTPPWNRCTRETGRVLVEAGLPVLSRESRAEPLDVDGLVELPVHVDWFAHRKGVRLSREELGGALAAEALGGGPVGVMLHHAQMDAGERRMLSELLDLLTASAGARRAAMAELKQV
jgi:peptidoglycan/xylan/chitin deacetylase (PgdA/CDA1 family)